ncbi:hypothetical protein PGN35_004070 [Nodosilinea sp. PGN35]|uniref:hypothetical protein n=1 Tax=Nodosilinea sp. PGN35 TaxID=3020489 RepID=UPI0023B2A419|nr:hypothetical protein [Nodosilinea sp. TSF1-S3]MDF0365796.1 hypothetical protein [Nodosilinea sp. TSF1-S3]
MTLTAIVDQLQSIELDAKGTFADDPFTSARALLSQNQPEPMDGNLGTNLVTDLDSDSYAMADIPQPPIGAAELETQVTGQLESLHQINVDSLAAAIPQNPGAEAFSAQELMGVQNSMGDLTTSIVGTSDFGSLNVPASDPSLSAEFDAFLKGAAAFPSRLLNALIKAFKALLEKLKNPDAWLDELSETALTDVFVEQIQGVAASLPPVALGQGAAALQTRGEQALELAQMLRGINRQTATEADLAQQRQKARQMELILDDCDRILTNATLRVDGFAAKGFVQLLQNLPSDQGEEIQVLSQIFNPITRFVTGLNERITDITAKLKNLIEQVKALLETGIAKVQEITDRIVAFIKQKLATARQALERMEAYINQAIGVIQDFIKQAGNQVEQIVAQAKRALSQMAATAEAGIKSLAATVKAQTDQVKQAIEKINSGIDQNLNDQALQQKIRDLLGKVTSQLERKEVEEAIKTADQGIDKMAKALEQITLKSSFDLAVTKSKTLEGDLRKINVASLGIAQKTALGVGKKVLESVDVPGVVNPELKRAFEEVLAPVLNIVDQVQQEVNQIKEQVVSFEPGKLLEDFLQPHIDSFVKELNQYRPSELLKSIKGLYDKILHSLNKLDPNQLVVMLEGLYQKIVNMAQVLSPEGLIKLLEDQKSHIQDLLNTLPVGSLIDRIKAALGSVEKLFAGLGLDEMLDSGFWNDLKDMFNLNLDEPLQKLDQIQATINQRVTNIAEERLRRELDNLSVAVHRFAEHPKADYSAAKEALDNGWHTLSAALNSLKAENSGLDSSSPPVTRTDVYYEELSQRLDVLYQRLISESEALALGEIYNAWLGKIELIITKDRRTAEVSRLVPGDEDMEAIKAALKSNDELVAAFKAVLPEQLEKQFVAPIRNILTMLNQVLKQPGEILDQIDEVLQALLEAPGRIIQILAAQTERLRQDLTDTIAALSTAAGDVIDGVSETLRLAYQLVEKTLRSLRPTTLLNSFEVDDLRPEGLASLMQKLKANLRDPISDLLWQELDTSQRLLLEADQLKGEAIVVALNNLLTTRTLYPASRALDTALPEHGQLLADKFPTLAEDHRLRLNRILLETVYGDALVLSMQSIFPFFMQTLKDFYPEAVIQQLDETHAKIVAVVRNLPKHVAAAVQDAYANLMKKFEELIGTRIDRIFLELKKPLWRLQRDLDIGLEDISGAYRRLLSAVPV